MRKKKGVGRRGPALLVWGLGSNFRWGLQRKSFIRAPTLGARGVDRVERLKALRLAQKYFHSVDGLLQALQTCGVGKAHGVRRMGRAEI